MRQDGAGLLPRIVATGRGKLAEQILELAFANGVRVREDANLAEILATLDLDSEIPSEAIVAVAEILTRVYEANAALSPATTAQTADKAVPLAQFSPHPSVHETDL